MPSRLNFTREREQEIAAMYQSGLSTVDLSRRFHIATATVSRILRDCGVKQRSLSESASLRSSEKPAGQYSGRSGVFWSEKSRRWIPTASTYEYIRMDQLDRDPCVRTFRRCPDRIPYEFDGAVHHYTPDIEVSYTDGSIVVEEIKPRGLANRAITRIKAQAALSHYSALNIGYEIVTEDQIGDEEIENFDWDGIEKVNKDHISQVRKDALRKYKAEWTRKKRASTPASPAQRRKNADRQSARYHRWRQTATPEQIQKHREKQAAYMRERRKTTNS